MFIYWIYMNDWSGSYVFGALRFSFPGMCDSSPSWSFQKHAILAGCILPILPPFPSPFSLFSVSCLYSRTTPEAHCQRILWRYNVFHLGPTIKEFRIKQTWAGFVCFLTKTYWKKKFWATSKQYNHLELYANRYIQIDPRRNVEIVLVT